METQEWPIEAVKQLYDPTQSHIELCARWRDMQGKRGGVKCFHPILYPEARYRACSWIPPAGYSSLYESEDRAHAQKLAQERVDLYGRVVCFINATGLKPSRAHWDYFGLRYGEQPPGVDHTLFWHDGNKNYVVTTNPYGGYYHLGEMQEWCENIGWTIAAAAEGNGLWYAGTTLIALAPPKRGVDVDLVVARAKAANCCITR